ncbi:hypothetical protein L6452_05698 [Arctium lappa]|uniref:Uncharacterized protein n=1 Tax=Arctium lappa TaxID=4217 RepID=A0ACB9EHB5_ARCLA|nr:hypothetical protein L6452_05698 [Arctium lappa]
MFNPSLLQYMPPVCSVVEIPSIDPTSIYKGINIHRVFSSGSCLHRQATFPATGDRRASFHLQSHRPEVCQFSGQKIYPGWGCLWIRFYRFQDYVGQTLLILENINQDLSNLNFLASQFLRSHLERIKWNDETFWSRVNLRSTLRK